MKSSLGPLIGRWISFLKSLSPWIFHGMFAIQRAYTIGSIPIAQTTTQKDLDVFISSSSSQIGDPYLLRPGEHDVSTSYSLAKTQKVLGFLRRSSDHQFDPATCRWSPNTCTPTRITPVYEQRCTWDWVCFEFQSYRFLCLHSVRTY